MIVVDTDMLGELELLPKFMINYRLLFFDFRVWFTLPGVSWQFVTAACDISVLFTGRVGRVAAFKTVWILSGCALLHFYKPKEIFLVFYLMPFLTRLHGNSVNDCFAVLIMFHMSVTEVPFPLSLMGRERLTRLVVCLVNLVGLFNASIRERVHKKHLGRGEPFK